MDVTKLLRSLEALAGFAQQAGSKKASDALKSLGDVLGEKQDVSVSDAVKELREVLATERLQVRDKYVLRLNDAGTDEGQFTAALSDLEQDKSVTKDDADAIAHAYTNGRDVWPSRKAALKAMRTTFVERAYQEGKMRIVENYKLG